VGTQESGGRATTRNWRVFGLQDSGNNWEHRKVVRVVPIDYYRKVGEFVDDTKVVFEWITGKLGFSFYISLIQNKFIHWTGACIRHLITRIIAVFLSFYLLLLITRF
jgi:hypothetical protein